MFATFTSAVNTNRSIFIHGEDLTLSALPFVDTVGVHINIEDITLYKSHYFHDITFHDAHPTRSAFDTGQWHHQFQVSPSLGTGMTAITPRRAGPGC